ncbi:actin-bundling T4SS effector WalE1 family protein [Wolbachia endosymbiont of Frankliniella intonsa]|uniref:actin-bundling T4SS effector WalE1 family protein n=1 Tax=Wolbachia endosymbiont of Frankliniella intonsa TaxID=2902422 RepID=UPI00244E844E|nr:hypothetical protein [Wolbachia endosymbiont of Frankliniella intonsa]WGJ61965.1 hypothetical protein M3L71_06850 [Wolbachia endosymbiont of Frankliniella intonsa]
MSPSEKNSSNFVENKQDDLKMIQDSSLNSDIIHDPKKLKDRIMDLVKGDTEFSKMKQGDKALVVGTASGLFTAVLPLLAVGATLAIPGAIVGLTLFFAVKVAVKAVQSGYKGLKWSAEKTVEGAKHIGGKIKDGAVYAKNSVKETASSVKQATQERASSTLRKMGDNIQNLGRKMSDSGASMSSLDGIPYSIGNEDQTVILKTTEKTRNFNSVKEMLTKKVFEDKAVNGSAFTKEMFSKLVGKISEKSYPIDDQRSAKKDQLTNLLDQQIDFINKLDAKKLQHLLDKDNSNLYEIFSEHHGEIKEIIRECKKEHNFFNTLERLNKSAKRHKASSMNSLENSLSGSSSTSSISTVSSKADLLNPNENREVKEPTSFWSKLLSPLKGVKKPEEVTCTGYKRISEDEMPSAEIGNSRFYVAPEKPLRSNSMGSLSTHSTATTSSFASYLHSSDSGFNSPSSSPQHGMFTEKNGKLKTQDNLRKTGSLEKLVGPSSTVTAEAKAEQQTPHIKVK